MAKGCLKAGVSRRSIGLMKLIVAELVGNKKIDNVVDVGDGSDKNSQSFGGRIKIAGTTAGGGGNTSPGSNIREPGRFENLGVLTQNDPIGPID